ncbi:MAG: hypothetical protein IJK90_08255 [Bacteroidales bacterium]|nr:hypothetical protein [Bacteroidales bacterium]
MTDKEKYTELARRFWEAETSPEEERDLAGYAANVDDPEFDELRGVLGYLSVGRRRRIGKGRRLRMYSVAAAASIAAFVAISLSLLAGRSNRIDDVCVSYVYGVQTVDSDEIMASVESSLADFFAGETPAEIQLTEMFRR